MCFFPNPGSTPQYISDEWMDSINRWVDDDPNLELIVKTSTNGYKQYLKSRPGASNESVKRSKKLQKENGYGYLIILKVLEKRDSAQYDYFSF